MYGLNTDLPGHQLEENLTQMLADTPVSPAVLTQLKGYLNFNKFMQMYECFIASKGYEFEKLQFIFKFYKINEYEVEGDKFKSYNYDLIDILDDKNESVIHIDEYLKELRGCSFNQKRYESFKNDIGDNPFVLHGLSYVGEYLGHNYYSYLYSPIAKEDIKYVNELLKTRKAELFKGTSTLAKAVKFNFKNKRSPK